ncbi:hypothetical protein ACBY01_11490 [Sphingomonas sp. ac-8]|uniref:hypothetical protein n=1 Tax=Sphingomonas sp. ac-8 TaxID=3242977 RepID=UPI003A80ECBE
MFQRLQDYHAWMLAILDEVEPLLRDGVERPSARYLSVRREAMGRTLSAYQRFVHQEFFDPLIAGGSAADAALARAMKIECIDMTEGFRRIQRKWMGQDVSDHWEEYRAVALEMMAQMRRHIADVASIARAMSPASDRSSPDTPGPAAP